MAEDGKVVYKVEVDDSQVSSDMKKTESKIKKSSEEASDAQKQDNKEVVQDAKESTNKVSSFFSSAFEKIKESSGGMKDGVLEGFDVLTEGIGLSASALAKAGLVAGIAAIGSAAVKMASDIESSINKFSAQTGIAGEELDKYQTMMEEIYASNYGESFEDVANAVSSIKLQFDDIDDESLQSLTEGALTLRDTFDMDLNESLRGMDQLMTQFGLSAEEAMDLMASGAQNGLNYTDELGDNISEYAGKFAQAGYSAKDYFQLLKNGTQGGAYNLDKVNDAINEITTRLADGTIEESLDMYSEKTKEVFKQWQNGEATQKEVIDSIVEDIQNCTNEQDKLTMSATAFGTMGEDANAKFVESLTSVGETFNDVNGTMEEVEGTMSGGVNAQIEALKRNVEMLLVPIGELLLPILNVLIGALAEIIGVISDVINTTVDWISNIVNFEELFSFYIDNAMQSFNSFVEFMKNGIDSMKQVLDGIIQFITGVFEGNWSKAWEGIKSIFSGIVSGIANIFKQPINTIIDGINSFIRGVNKIKIPDWVPVVGGKGFNIKTIPRLKVGMDFVPNDYFPAFLDYGEAVLTREENAKLRSLGGISGIENMIEGSFSNNVGFDYDKLASAMANLGIYMDGQKVGYMTTNGVDQNMGLITSRKGRYGI